MTSAKPILATLVALDDSQVGRAEELIGGQVTRIADAVDRDREEWER